MLKNIPSYIAAVDREAVVVFIVCGIVLVLFVVAGIRDIVQRKDNE